MENEKITCPECKTENEPDYKFCKNCGTPLHTDYTAHRQNFTENTACDFDEVDGVSTEKLQAFVGKNGREITAKWVRAKSSGKTTAFCAPVFLLTLFFGLAGAAFWFLYRRMYKAGAALLIGAVGLSIVFTAATIRPVSVISEDYMRLVEKYSQGASMEELEDEFEIIAESEAAVKIEIAARIQRFIKLIFAFVLGFTALMSYKKFAISRIGRFGGKLETDQLYLIGGTSGGALALGMVLYAMVRLAIMIISVIAIVM